MKGHTMKATRVMGIDRDAAFLHFLRRKIEMRFPNCAFEMVKDSWSAIQLILQTTYDLLIVDTREGPDHALLDLAARRGLPVLAVFSRRTRPEALRAICTPEVRAFVCKDRHEDVVESIERALTEKCTPWWRQTIRRLMGGAAEHGGGAAWHGSAPLYRSDDEIYGMLKGDLYLCQ